MVPLMKNRITHDGNMKANAFSLRPLPEDTGSSTDQRSMSICPASDWYSMEPVFSIGDDVQSATKYVADNLYSRF